MKSELPVKLVPFGEPLVANLRALKMQLHAPSTSCRLEALDACLHMQKNVIYEKPNPKKIKENELELQTTSLQI
jgi:hypothetical protein